MSNDAKVRAGSEQRRSRRYKVPMAISLEAGERKGRVGIALDVSVLGARFNTASRFAEGDSVTLTLMHQANPALATCVGRVVRIERADMKSDLLWRYVTAVRFERPLTDIESTLRRSVPLSAAG
jgi:hypothetical protein